MSEQIQFSFKAVYEQLISESADKLIFVLHGYGQLPQYFIRKFQFLQSDGWDVVAPGGLSRFYLEGFSGRVGATWMTKEQRQVDIENYVAYLSAVYTELVKSKAYKKIVLLGFSQGGATASRWLSLSDWTFDQLILWASVFPPDMPIEENKEKLSKLGIQLAIGNQDPFISKQRKDELMLFLEKSNLPVQIYEFEGAHDIEQATLQKILEIG